MISAIIGRRFLDHYKQQRGSNLSAKEFFEQVFLPLFYDHPKYMMDGGNTALTNPKIPKGSSLTQEQRQNRFATLIKNIEAKYLDNRTALDFPSLDENSVTSGQVTDLSPTRSSDTAYCSWIGNGLGVGIGGVTVLFDHPIILEAVFEGWQHYRYFLNYPAYKELPGNKIHAWNATWLNHFFGKYYRPEDQLLNFSPINRDKKGNLTVKGGFWANPLFSIASKLSPQPITGYIFQISDRNKTFGFVRFDLPQVKRLPELYKHLFGEYADQRDTKEVEGLYGSGQAFLLACQKGVVGVSALEPAGLIEFAYPSQRKQKEGKSEKKGNGWFNYDPNDSKSKFIFNTYQTWLLSMLKRSDYWDKANSTADLLLAYERGAEKARTDRINRVNKVLAAKTQSAFIDELCPVLQNIEPKSVQALTEITREIHELPPDSFSYFRILIKFRYIERVRMADIKTNNNQTE